jgi:hypothetical protein
MTTTRAREGHAFFRVETAAVFREYELPTAGKLTGAARQQYEALKDLAEIHRTGIQSSPYRVG